jgi:PAS domain S-box-containing protein
MTSGLDDRRILIVDDEPDFLETLADILGPRGYEVTVAQGPDEALARVRTTQPSVALLDIRLGRASGIDLLAEMRAAAPGLVVVMMTAYADVETAVQALTEGAHHYLRKPIDPRDLLATLERCFERVRLEAEKAAAEAALRARNAELAELNERLQQMVAAARSLASCSRLEDLNRQLLEESARVMAAEGGSLFSRRENAFELIWSLDADHAPSVITLPLAPGSVFARVLESKGPIVVRDIASTAGLKGSGWEGYRDGSLLVFPIVHGGQVEALLSLHNKTWPPFTEQDRELGQIMISLSAEILKTQQAAEAVRRSEERYRLLAENVTDVIFTADSALRLTYVSPSVTRLTGHSVEEVITRGLEGIVAPTAIDSARGFVRETLAAPAAAEGVHPRTREVELRRNDGSAVWTEVTISVVRGPEGDSVLGVARDLTERRKTQKQLVRLATAVEQAAEDLIITDAAGVIQYVNPAFEQVTGYSRAEVVGLTPSILRSGVHDATFYRGLWDTISSGGTWRGRLTNRRKDGTFVLEEGAISPIRDPEGQIVGYVSAKHDVTKQAGLEARLAQAQKMESIGRLAGGIAHDFNNILVAIIGFVELLERATLGERPLRYVHGIGAAAWRAADLTKQILTFSRQGSLDRKPLEIGPVVREALKLMRAALPASVEIRDALTSEIPVAANATQLHQIVVNLCTNAGLAMRDGGGVLDVSLDDVDVDSSMVDLCPPLSPGRHVCLRVSDTGCGMTADVLARVFDPFFTTREPGEGTGMGLAVVHGIVEDHGGAITVSSTPGEGSSFRVFLPSIVGTSPLPTTAAGPETPGRERVLFVDDEEVQTELARQLLGSLGYVVTAAKGGQEALAQLRTAPRAFDVVVTDIAMKGMPGDTLAEEIHRIRADLPVVLCTGFSERALAVRKWPPSIREFLVKPYSLSDLSAAVRRALASPGMPAGN